MRILSPTDKHILFEFLILIGILSSVGVIAAYRYPATTIASHGNLKVNGVGVYQDANCSIAVEYLDWRTLEPGSAENITVYVRNEGNRAATLFLETNNWNPVNASSYMTVSWDYSGQTLNPTENSRITLTLSISSDVKDIVDFSFDIIIGTS